jgi:hypothetical protein
MPQGQRETRAKDWSSTKLKALGQGNTNTQVAAEETSFSRQGEHGTEFDPMTEGLQASTGRENRALNQAE